MVTGIAERRAANQPDGTPAPRRSAGFLLLYAIASAGGVVGFLPLLTLLLPMKIERIAGADRLDLFSVAIVLGALAASGANLLFGWLSDRSLARGGGRRSWIVLGVIGTAMSYAWMALAQHPLAIILALVTFQTALNALLAPLAALMGDEIPDAQKGVTAGLLSFSIPAGAAIGALVIGLSGREDGRLAVIMVICAVAVLPVTLTRAQPLPRPICSVPTPASRRNLGIVWCGRMLIQTANIVLQLYLLYFFEGIAHDVPPAILPSRLSHLLTIASLVPILLALFVGWLSDRIGRRKPFLLGAALLASVGLVAMAGARDWTEGALAYGLYALGAGVLIPLQAAYSVQLLPDPDHRGRDLGILNLTNTLPSLFGPLLTWLLATPGDFTALLLVLAGLCTLGGLGMMAVRGSR